MLNPAMNNTKWDELRLEMYALTPPPSWSTLSTNGYRSSPDREWFYHFREGGYESSLTWTSKSILPSSESLFVQLLRRCMFLARNHPKAFACSATYKTVRPLLSYEVGVASPIKSGP